METLIDSFVIKSRKILKENLTGIYLHGSAVMGCFNTDKSDIDLIVVVNEPVTDIVKREFLDMVVKLNAQGPAKGIEMSVVTKDVCNPFIYPTPFDLHFSEAHLGWYQRDPEDYIEKMKGTDKDLAAHFTVIVNRGRCLFGASINEVFAEVPKADYFDSIYDDISGAPDEIAENTMYFTLNLSRVLAYKQEGLILSKKEGGEWAFRNLPEKYHELIRNALHEYTQGTAISYNIELAKSFAIFVLEKI